MDVLQNERKAGLSAVCSPAAFAYGTSWRVQKKCSIVCLSVVVAGRAESEGAGQNQERRGKAPPVVLRVDQRGIKRRNVGPPLIELPFEGPEGCINAKRTQNDDDGQEFNPP